MSLLSCYGNRTAGCSEKKSVRFLIVENHRQIQYALKSMLKFMGYSEFKYADNGREALRIVKEGSIDFIITSWDLPNMTGLELLECVRRDPGSFQLPILMVAGESSPERIAYAVEEGIDGYLVKPFSAEAVMTAVRKIESKRNNRNPAQETIERMKHLKILKKYQEAIDLGENLSEEEKNAMASLITGECYIQIEDYENATHHLNKSLKDKETSKAKNLLGKAFQGMGKHEEAVGWLEDAVKQNPFNNNNKLDLAQAYFTTGREEEAREIVASVAGSDPTDLVLARTGRLYLDLGDLKKAGTFLDKIKDPPPESVDVLNKYALLLRRSGDYEKSFRVYKRCLDAVPFSPSIHYNFAFLCFKMDLFDKARELVESAIQLNSDFEPAHKLLQMIDNRPS